MPRQERETREQRQEREREKGAKTRKKDAQLLSWGGGQRQGGIVLIERERAKTQERARHTYTAYCGDTASRENATFERCCTAQAGSKKCV